jgi:hypothetical protein
MKSKLMMLISIGALALTASVPNAMAKTKVLGNSRSATAVSTSKAVATKKAASRAAAGKTAVSKKVSCGQDQCRAAVPPHTIISGATHNPW